jgi:hypothetical protein
LVGWFAAGELRRKGAKKPAPIKGRAGGAEKPVGDRFYIRTFYIGIFYLGS